MARKNEKYSRSREKNESETIRVGLQVTTDIKRSIGALFCVVLAVLLTLGYLENAGILGRMLNTYASLGFGWGKWLFPVILVVIALILLKRKIRFCFSRILGVLIAYVGILGLFHVFYPFDRLKTIATLGEGGGFLGYWLGSMLITYVGFITSVIILIVLVVVGFLFFFHFSLISGLDAVSEKFSAFRQKKFAKSKDSTEDLSQFKEANKSNNSDDWSDSDDLDDQNDQNNLSNLKKEGEKEDKNFYSGYYGHVFEDDGADRSGSKEGPRVFSEVYKSSGGESTGMVVSAGSDVLADDVSDDSLLKPRHGNIANIRFDEDKSLFGVEEQGDDSIHSSGEEFEEIKEINGEFRDESDNLPKKRNKERIAWKLPDTSLLNREDKQPAIGNPEERKKIIVEKFEQFGIHMEACDYQVGPTVTQYRFRPAPSVRLDKITSFDRDLALSLEAFPIRIEAPIPGKALVGIEVPNQSAAIVGIRSLLESQQFRADHTSPLRVALGKDVNGSYVLEDLDCMPHLLIAGTTGSGKSVCLHSLLTSLLFQCTPKMLNLILVDPKFVELPLYEGIPHLRTPVITESKKAINALKWAVVEMERRLKILGECKVQNIADFNQKVRDGKAEEYNELPYTVIVIDELADLMQQHRRDVEPPIVRISQKARAAGIHLVLATQKPVAEVITGIIKGNISTRIALKVPSQVDSRTILDTGGAEKLLIKGDMLYQTASTPHLKRLQGAYVSREEVEHIVEYWMSQKKAFDSDDPEDDLDEEGSDSEEDIFADMEEEHEDELFDKAREAVIEAQKASTSFLQRRLRIGYNRAARLIDELEEAGVIGSQNGAKPREVLVGQNESEEDFEDE